MKTIGSDSFFECVILHGMTRNCLFMQMHSQIKIAKIQEIKLNKYDFSWKTYS